MNEQSETQLTLPKEWQYDVYLKPVSMHECRPMDLFIMKEVFLAVMGNLMSGIAIVDENSDINLPPGDYYVHWMDRIVADGVDLDRYTATPIPEQLPEDFDDTDIRDVILSQQRIYVIDAIGQPYKAVKIHSVGKEHVPEGCLPEPGIKFSYIKEKLKSPSDDLGFDAEWHDEEE